VAVAAARTATASATDWRGRRAGRRCGGPGSPGRRGPRSAHQVQVRADHALHEQVADQAGVAVGQRAAGPQDQVAVQAGIPAQRAAPPAREGRRRCTCLRTALIGLRARAGPPARAQSLPAARRSRAAEAANMMAAGHSRLDTRMRCRTPPAAHASLAAAPAAPRAQHAVLARDQAM